MKGVWDYVSSLGISSNDTEQKIKKIRISNQITFSLTIVAFSYAFIFYFLGMKKEGLGVSIVVLSMSLSLLFNHYKLFVYSRLWFILVINVAVIIYTALFGRDSGIQLVFFSFVALPWLLFEFKDRKYILMGILLPCVSYYISIYYFRVAVSDISPVVQNRIYFAIIIAVFLILGLCMYFFVAQHNKAEQSLLTSRNSLRIRNEKLTEIAWIQSHKLRAPLATIMGLIPLINTEKPDDEENKQTLKNIKAAGEDLDKIIAEVDQKTRLTED